MFPVDVVSKSLQEVMKVTQKIENSKQLVIGLRFRDFAVSAVCAGPQLISLKLWLSSEMTTTSFAEAEDDGVRPSVWMTSLAAPIWI